MAINPVVYLQAGVILLLWVIPFVFPSFKLMDVMAKIMIFTLVVASFDLLLGYTGILSFAHGMFFGIGAYSVALILYHSITPMWYHILFAVMISLVISIGLSLMIAFFSLRVKAIFFAMLTLALAEFAHILGVQWTSLTGGEDGISFVLPSIFNFNQSLGTLFNTPINGRLIVYYLILVSVILLFAGLLRFIRSPLGRVLKAIRENEPRTIALGYETFGYQIYAIVFSASVASLGGILFSMWLCYVNPDSVFHTAIMVNILLMVLIGGMGTLYGSMIGAAFLIITENWLPGLLKSIAALTPENIFVRNMADRWQLYFGILFVLVVIFFPKGVIGTIRSIMNLKQQIKFRSQLKDIS
ncbi:MAG: branched-chain amino acid ABC transporter permease [Proteobacteria bacterium]|nr:branched-chain amino acid ABC transporter permease [Pseudomonadota bacterium]MBU1581842.1 branched-chain amino acid ABC transporter permease [Pseudomonadota bacterium]MBU2455610.1 branched-chain amino acid ABC transporter permease [Pseudomonadota bacterium]MBU2630365.1 branched-chain amino acid ABC transporter permease [Pseudomonadota bacterium]